MTSSALAADKDLSKVMYERAGIPVAPGVSLVRGQSYDLDEILSIVGDHCFVKPAVNGSSYGITYVKKAEDLQAAIDVAFSYGDKVLIEKRIEAPRSPWAYTARRPASPAHCRDPQAGRRGLLRPPREVYLAR